MVTGILFERSVGMGIADRGPAQWSELGRGIEFHGAGSERNHGLSGSKIKCREAADVAEEFIFIGMGSKNRMAERRGGTGKRTRDRGNFCGRSHWFLNAKKGE